MKNLLIIIFLTLLYSTSHGQDKFVFVFLNSNPDKAAISQNEIDSLQKGHLKNIERLASERKLAVAGPFEGGGGIFILNTTSVKEARAWISTDPAINAGRYRIEVLPWTPRVGSVCLPEKEAEFITYTFIRYNTFITKFNVRNAPELFRQHDVYLKAIEASGNVISEGVFGNSDGGTLIMKGEVGREVIMNDPTVKNGIIQPDIKQIWVATGSFCEH